MSPLPVAAAAGAVKAKTAKEMAAFAKMMNKTDWSGVESAMQSIMGFAESASLVQETLGNIKTMSQDIVDIALADALSKVEEKASELFDQLVPLATAINNLTGGIDTSGIEELTRLLRIFNTVVAAGATPVDLFTAILRLFVSEMNRGKNAVEWFLETFGALLGWLLGGPPPDISPPPGRDTTTLPGLGKIGDIEEGF